MCLLLLLDLSDWDSRWHPEEPRRLLIHIVCLKTRLTNYVVAGCFCNPRDAKAGRQSNRAYAGRESLAAPKPLAES